MINGKGGRNHDKSDKTNRISFLYGYMVQICNSDLVSNGPSQSIIMLCKFIKFLLNRKECISVIPN